MASEPDIIGIEHAEAERVAWAEVAERFENYKLARATLGYRHDVTRVAASRLLRAAEALDEAVEQERATR